MKKETFYLTVFPAMILLSGILGRISGTTDSWLWALGLIPIVAIGFFIR